MAVVLMGGKRDIKDMLTQKKAIGEHTHEAARVT
jgi:hypothetical protein